MEEYLCLLANDEAFSIVNVIGLDIVLLFEEGFVEELCKVAHGGYN